MSEKSPSKEDLIEIIAHEGHSFPHYSTCKSCEEDFDRVAEWSRNQTLAEVLKIVEQITNRDGDINVFQLKEEIKKIQSPESMISNKNHLNNASKDIQSQEGSNGNISKSSTVCNTDNLVLPDTNTQNLKGCGKMTGFNQKGNNYRCGQYSKYYDSIVLCEKCQGKVKE